MAFEHESVLLGPVLELLASRDHGIYVDGTLGGAGHARAHAYSCAMTRGTWLVVPFAGIATDPKPRPRRFTRIS